MDNNIAESSPPLSQLSKKSSIESHESDHSTGSQLIQSKPGPSKALRPHSNQNDMPQKPLVSINDISQGYPSKHGFCPQDLSTIRTKSNNTRKDTDKLSLGSPSYHASLKFSKTNLTPLGTPSYHDPLKSSRTNLTPYESIDFSDDQYPYIDENEEEKQYTTDAKIANYSNNSVDSIKANLFIAQQTQKFNTILLAKAIEENTQMLETVTERLGQLSNALQANTKTVKVLRTIRMNLQGGKIKLNDLPDKLSECITTLQQVQKIINNDKPLQIKREKTDLTTMMSHPSTPYQGQ